MYISLPFNASSTSLFLTSTPTPTAFEAMQNSQWNPSAIQELACGVIAAAMAYLVASLRYTPSAASLENSPPNPRQVCCLSKMGLLWSLNNRKSAGTASPESDLVVISINPRDLPMPPAEEHPGLAVIQPDEDTTPRLSMSSPAKKASATVTEIVLATKESSTDSQ